MKQVLIAVGVLVLVVAIIYEFGAYGGRQDAKAARAETYETQKQINKDARTTEEAEAAIREKEILEENHAKEVEKNKKLEEENKQLKEKVRMLEKTIEELQTLLEGNTSPVPPSPDPGFTPVPIPRGEDDDINVPGWLCPTRFC